MSTFLFEFGICLLAGLCCFALFYKCVDWFDII